MLLWTLCQAAAGPAADDLRAVLERRTADGDELAIAAVCDYEARRELLRKGANSQLKRLDELRAYTLFVPFRDAAMRQAAVIWAQLRNTGQPIGHPEALDGDVILAAHAKEYSDHVVVTENLDHVSRVCNAVHWQAL